MSQTQFKIEIFRSSDNNSLSNSIVECLGKLNNHVLSFNDCQLFKSTLYFQSGTDFSQDLLTIKSILEANLPNQTMPVSIVNQPPLSGERVCLEVWCIINCQPNFTVHHKTKNGNKYTLLEANGFSCLSVSVASHEQELFEHNVKKTFEDLSFILKDEGYDFSDIVRQWNYLNDIVVEKTDELDKIQNYQIFNEYRALYYYGLNFIFGYPAATGIGMSNGGIVIDVIAQKGNNCCIVPLQNPKQQDAHHYSENVLKCTLQTNGFSRPLFERGKFFEVYGLNLLFISGTASIRGEDTIHIGNVEEQTHTTIENINLLVSDINLKNHGIVKSGQPKMLNYVVYLKYANDFKTIQAICKRYFGDTPAVFLLADICRKELLVEIEANYELT